MRIFLIELNNDIKGILKRKQYIESLIAELPDSDIIFLPEMAVCSYMASQEAWQYADECGKDTSEWAMQMAEKYNTCIGVGYLDYENGDYYNRYLIADKRQVFGVVTKSEGEAAVFKRGSFGNIICTPFGNIAIGICYDAKRKHLYDNIKDEEIVLMAFPHGCPADPQKPEEEIAANDFFCEKYENAFGVPVVYINSIGKLEYMPGKMGSMMRKSGFTMNGKSKIYCDGAKEIPCTVKEAMGIETDITPHRRVKDIRFYGEDLIKGNLIFRRFILQPDIKYGIKLYNKYVH